MLKIINRFKKPTGIHSLHIADPKTFKISDFELATWVLSILSYKDKVGKIVFCGDFNAINFIKQNGVYPLYDEIIPICINSLVDTNRFWAASKIYALEKIKAPCVLMDLDLILLKRPNPFFDVVALHEEPLSWETYKSDVLQSILQKSIVNNGWSECLPLNTALLAFFSEDIKEKYVNVAKNCMERGSLIFSEKPISMNKNGSCKNISDMVFAEQYALAAVLKSYKSRVKLMSSLNDQKNHISLNDEVVHLWNSKDFYSKHDRAKERYLDWCMESIYNICKDSIDYSKIRTIIFKSELPNFRVIDPNSGVVRWSYSGEWIGPGEDSNWFATWI